MGPNTFVEGLFGGHLPMTPQSQFHNEFASLNDISIPDDFPRTDIDDAH